MIRASRLAAVALFLGASGGSAQAVRGTVSEATLTSEAATPMMGAVTSRTTVRSTSAAGNVRVDVLAAEGPGPYMAGDVVVRVDTLVYHLRPDAREYAVVDASLALAALPPGLSVTVSEPSVTVDRLGPGEAVAGQATERFRIRTAMTMTLPGFGGGMMEIRMESDEDILAAATEHRSAWNVMREPGRLSPDSPLAPVAAAAAKVMEGLGGRTPLRAESHTRLSLPGGMQTDNRATYLVTELRETAVEQALFRLPDGYRRVESLPPRLQ